jgi:pantoate--beta-alanine ligase
MKLFQAVQPSVAVFGKKDYQQLRVIQAMVRQFALPVDIVAGETGRSAGGLALSSRNGYLSEAELLKAHELAQTLREVAARVTGEMSDRSSAGRAWVQRIEADAIASLRSNGWAPDYVRLCTQDRLEPWEGSGPGVVLAAAKLGSTRLIDNLEFVLTR